MGKKIELKRALFEQNSTANLAVFCPVWLCPQKGPVRL